MRDNYTWLTTTLNPLIWPQLLHFNPREKWGNFEKMDIRLLWNLDRLRHDIARCIRVHCGYEISGHAKRSFHTLGMAVDFHFEDLGIGNELHDLYTCILEMWHGGVGVYPFWNSPGYHLDIGPDRTWVRDKAGVYHYESHKIKEVILSCSKDAL